MVDGMSEYAVGDKVTCRFMPGSVGMISEVERSISMTPVGRARFEAECYMDPATLLMLRDVFRAIGIECSTASEIEAACAAVADLLGAVAAISHEA